MKTLFTIIAVLISLTAFTQDRRDNTIIITTDYEYSEAYRMTGQVLTSNGLTIDHADRDFGTIATRSKDIGTIMEPGWSVKAIVLIKDNIIIIQGVIKNNAGKQSDVRFVRGGMYRKGWDELHQVAEDIGGTITYEQR